MKEVLEIEITWLLECMEIFLFMKMVLIQKITQNKWKLFMSGMIGTSSICIVAMTTEHAPFILLLITIMLFFLLLEESCIHRICLFFFVWFLMPYLKNVYCVILSLFRKKDFYVYVESYPSKLFPYVLGICIYVIVGLIVKKNDIWKRFWITIPDTFFFIATFCEFLFYFYFMSSFDLAKQYRNTTLRNLVILGSTGAGIAVIAVVIALFGANKLKVHYKMESLLKDKYLSVSRDYCNMILENEKDIRKMRHDMRGHITALEYLLKEKKYDALSEYLRDMDKEIEKNTLIRATGNELLDAILTRYQMDEENISYDVIGVFSYQKMKEYDLCILFSNMISNAVEACGRLDENERIVTICFKQIGENFIMSVSNPTEDEVNVKQLGSYTTKVDLHNHGFGIQRMREVVKKYNGTIDFKGENNKFMVTVIFT